MRSSSCVSTRAAAARRRSSRRASPRPSPLASSSTTGRSSDGGAARSHGGPDLRRRVRDVPGERALAHAPGAVRRCPRDPPVPLRAAAQALPADLRHGVHGGDAARPARRSRARGRRRGARAPPAHPRARLARRGLRAPRRPPARPTRVRVDREESHADLLRGAAPMTPGYQLVRTVIRLLLRLFYRRIDVVGRQRIPATRPLLAVANHHNTIVDAMQVVMLFLTFLLPVIPPRVLALAWRERPRGVRPPARALVSFLTHRDLPPPPP